MTLLSYNAVGAKLPANSVELVGNLVKANFSNLTGDALSLDSSCVEGTAKFLNALAQLTAEVNESRYQNGESSIKFVEKRNGYAEGEFEYVVTVQVDTSAQLNNLIDPTQT